MRKLLAPTAAAGAALLAACTQAPPEANFVDAVLRNVGSHALDALEQCPKDISGNSIRANLNCGDVGLEAEDRPAANGEGHFLHYAALGKNRDGTWGNRELVDLHFKPDGVGLEQVFAYSHTLGNRLDCRASADARPLMQCEWFGQANTRMGTARVPDDVFALAKERMDALVSDMLKAVP